MPNKPEDSARPLPAESDDSLSAGEGLDPTLLDPTRLAITAMLSGLEWVEFGVVCDRLDVGQPALSKQAAHLERSGHLSIRKGYVGKRPRTWLMLTPDGRSRLAEHVEALRRIIERATVYDT